jgi:hypothetical protein
MGATICALSGNFRLIAALAEVLHDARTSMYECKACKVLDPSIHAVLTVFVTTCRLQGRDAQVAVLNAKRSCVRQRRCQVGQKAVRTPGASLNLIVGYTPDGLNLRRHDRAAIVLELHTEPQVDAM